jgi:hypothetical protein
MCDWDLLVVLCRHGSPLEPSCKERVVNASQGIQVDAFLGLVALARYVTFISRFTSQSSGGSVRFAEPKS